MTSRGSGEQGPRSDSRAVATDLTMVAKDAAYVAIGLGVLGLQKAQVRRREIKSRLDALQGHLGHAGDAGDQPLKDVTQQLARAVKEVDQTVGELIERWDAAIDPLSLRLPAGAQAAISQAKDARDQLRSLLTSLASLAG
ncbi:MAG: hypothetical protein ACYCST_06910 [Acidimicrobiales bacterium]